MVNTALPAVNQRVDIWFEGYDQYYGGRVDSVSPPHNFHVILDDSSSWDVDRRRHIYRLSGDLPNSNTDEIPSTDETLRALNHVSQVGFTKQRRSSTPASATKARPGTRSSSRQQARRDSDSASLRELDNQLELDLVQEIKGEVIDVNHSTTDDDKSKPDAFAGTGALISSDPHKVDPNGIIVSVTGGISVRDHSDDQIPSENPDVSKPTETVSKPASRRRTSGRALRKNTIGPRSRGVGDTPLPFRKSIRSANTAQALPSKYNDDSDGTRQFRHRRATAKSVANAGQVTPSRARNANHQGSKGGAGYAPDGRTSYGRKRAPVDSIAVNSEAESELRLLKKRRLHNDNTSRGLSTARKSVRTNRLVDNAIPASKKNISPTVIVRPAATMNETLARSGPAANSDPAKTRVVTRSGVNPGVEKAGTKDAGNSLTPEAITAIAVEAALESARAILDPIDERLTKLLGELSTVSKGLSGQTKVIQQTSLETSDAEVDPTSSETEPATNGSTGDKQGGTPLIPMGSLQSFQVDVAEVIGGGEARIKAHSLQALQQFQSLRQLIAQQGQALKQMSSLVVAAEAFAGKSQKEIAESPDGAEELPEENGETDKDAMETN